MAVSAPEPAPAAQPATQPAKAIVGGVIAAASMAVSDVAIGLPWWQVLIDVLVNGLVVGGFVHQVPNRPKRNA